MPRTKRPVILRKDNAYKQFESVKDAAAFLGVRSGALVAALKHRNRHRSIMGFTAEYESEYVPQPKKDNTEKYDGLEVEIEGVVYRAQVKPNRVCADCDIYKENPPTAIGNKKGIHNDKPNVAVINIMKIIASIFSI